jgi:hypothetical protein
MIDYSDIEKVIEECFNELTAASREKYDSDKADKTAALFLCAQMKLSFVIEEVELQAKQAKNEITRIEGQKYFEYKTSNAEKKITENTLASHLSKDPDIVKAKLDAATSEASLKKWQFLMSTLKDSGYFFKNQGKNKQWSE